MALAATNILLRWHFNQPDEDLLKQCIRERLSKFIFGHEN
jgi:hypothetical protein